VLFLEKNISIRIWVVIGSEQETLFFFSSLFCCCSRLQQFLLDVLLCVFKRLFSVGKKGREKNCVYKSRQRKRGGVLSRREKEPLAFCVCVSVCMACTAPPSALNQQSLTNGGWASIGLSLFLSLVCFVCVCVSCFCFLQWSVPWIL